MACTRARHRQKVFQGKERGGKPLKTNFKAREYKIIVKKLVRAICDGGNVNNEIPINYLVT